MYAASPGESLASAAVDALADDGLADLADGPADHVAVSVVWKRRSVVLGGVDVLGGPSERTQAAKVVSDVELETRIEAGDMEACVVLLGALVGEGIGG